MVEKANKGIGEKKFNKTIKTINFISDFSAGLLTIVLLVIVLLQVFSRLTGLSSPWTEELTRYVFIWIIFIGVAIGFRNDESPRINFFVKLLPAKFQSVIKYSVFFLTLIFFIFLFVTGFNLLIAQLNEITPVLRISLAWVGLSIPVCALLSIFNLIQFFISSNKEIEEEN